MKFRTVIFVVLVLMGFTGSADAYLKFCNDSKSKMSVAIGYKKDGWVSKGWYTMQPNTCVNPLGGRLENRYYYYSVNVEGNGGVFEGDYTFCVDSNAFDIVGNQNCVGRNFRTQEFRQIDTGTAAREFTLRLTAAGGAVRGYNPTETAYGVPSNTATLSGLLFNYKHVLNDLSSLRIVGDWPVGPYEIGSSCSWSGGFLDLVDYSESWWISEDYNWTREELVDWINTTQSDMSGFEEILTNIQYSLGQLSNTKRGVKHSFGLVESTTTNFESGAWTMSQARSELSSALQGLRPTLETFQQTLTNLTKETTAQLDLLSTRHDFIKELVDKSHTDALAAIRSSTDANRTQRCSGGVAEKWASVTESVTSRYADLSKWYDPLNVSMRASETQLATLLQATVSAKGKLTTMMTLLNEIEKHNPGDFELLLARSTAQNHWADILKDFEKVWRK